ncbi:4Fe-4S ferredoxin [candidate division KSB3 bacterium]|uniref:4Fe-4S ferredoxin n=1 Tax=candidate division KSB3 bacterium TaxID=2044937 RepID=A0A2G6EAH2_9BACT|nr:MAG: 4Fe-4S ferredoxin [candidate division KSB3 bacterium]PIE31036.1 MAG: 4Fe-4S ferredoxin [candidate division KSB3 bacterium]
MQRKIIHIDDALCNGCEQCIPACPEQAIQIVETSDGPKARLVKELYCDGLGACLGNCPTGALTIEEREAEAYDDEATMERIKELAPDRLAAHKRHLAEHAAEMTHSTAEAPAFVCPSLRMLQIDREESAHSVPENANAVVFPSQLRQWPVQLHLVPPSAPYFKNAAVCIVADCVPFAYANFHQDFLKGEDRAIAVGCPKLDDTRAYLEKISQIIVLGRPKSITIVKMEVPCCSGLVRIVEQALRITGIDIPVKTLTISIKGEKMPTTEQGF